MKFIEAITVNNRFILKLFGIKVFSHKLKKKPKNNVVVLIKEDGTKVFNPKLSPENIRINFCGGYNVVKIYEPVESFHSVSLTLKNKDKVEIKSSKEDICRFHIECLGHTRVFIDEDFSIGNGIMVADYGSKVKIGKDCMFSFEIVMQTGDEHTIYDANADKLLGTGDIVIGNHVWAGYKSKILKKTVVPDGCIIGMDSTVTKAFDTKNSVIAGIPARLVKTGIFWDRKHYWEVKSQKLENEYIQNFKNYTEQ